MLPPPLIEYFIDERVPLPSSFQASSAPSSLPDIAYLSVLFYCTSPMLLLRYNPIRMHSLSLSPLVVPLLYPMLYILIYAYISEPYAILDNRIR